ncbi:MAG: asparagine synthase (glutamine-hydrolyzing) [Deltaproteobacteria bacterium]|nr:asparagine synthase (glutamine-hydrolyzing) [Deltaproteobacteria bacterium]
MCGLVAILGDDGGRLSAALDALAHRGPDGRGTWRGPGVALGHTRLAIRDQAGGHQPLVSADGQVAVVVNGELYGDLGAELEARGHRLRTRSDSEWVLHAYEVWGEACVERFAGELAFILWDGRRRRLVVGRDRFGIKPLVWARVPGGLAFASEAKALFALGAPAAWDHTSLRHVARHQYLPPHRTHFAGVHAVPPATVLTVEGERVSSRTYWQPPADEDPIDAGAAEEVRRLLAEAVQARLEAEAPVAFSLSGGLDSTGALAMAPRGQRAFSVRFPAAGYDELDAARQAALHLGAHLEVVEATPERLWVALPDAVAFSEGLCINAQLPAKYLLAQAIRASGAKVVISGEGADEAFLGYPHLLADHAAGAAASVAAGDPGAAALMLPAGAVEAPAVARALGRVPTFVAAKAELSAHLAGLLQEDLQVGPDPLSLVAEDLEACQRFSSFPRRAAWLWSRWALAGYILRTLGDGTEMAHGVEGRTPFLDHHLFERAWRLPADALFADGLEKATLRTALADVLPEPLRSRRKHPFVAPPLGDPEGRLWPELTARLLDRCPAPFARARVEAFLADFAARPAPERARRDPALMLLLSASILEERLGLTSSP